MPKKIAFDADSQGPKKISLPLDSEGGIDWSTVRPSVRDAFLSAVSNDVTTLEHIGMASSGGPGDGETGEDDLDLGITEADVHEALDELFLAESMGFRILAAKFLKHPLVRDREGKPVPLIIDADVASAAFKLSEKDHAKLDARVTRQVKKIPIPEWMKKNLDLWMIGIYLVKASMTNAQNAMKGQIRRDYFKVQAAAEKAKTASNRPPDSDVRPPTPHSEPVPSNGHASEESFDAEAAGVPEMPMASEFPQGPEFSAP